VRGLVAEAERVEAAETIKPRKSIEQTAGKTTPTADGVR